MIAGLQGACSLYKVGLELFTACGPSIVSAVQDTPAQVFLDLKLHDIPQTVARAAAAAAALGVRLLTVHAAGGLAMIRSAVEAAGPIVLGVTVLTSLDLADLAAVGTSAPSLTDLVVRRALLCQEAGALGVIASPREVRAIRAACGPSFLIVTPGVRPQIQDAAQAAGPGQADDQKRTGSARQAIADGADAVVVGRPVRDAKDRAAAVAALRAEIQAGLDDRHGGRTP
jgi:orotidine-5'-phosphate decarboxylase